MDDILNRLKNLHRPRLLVRAARHGITDYKRERDLRRLVKSLPLPGPREAIERLLDEEAEIEQSRCERDARYSIARHVEVIIALMGEAMLVRPMAAVVPIGQTKASASAALRRAT